MELDQLLGFCLIPNTVIAKFLSYLNDGTYDETTLESLKSIYSPYQAHFDHHLRLDGSYISTL
jgi:hypothetical protein